MTDSWKNYFAASVIDTASNRIKYAKQMGYDYIGITGNASDTASLKSAMTTQGVTGLKFYVIDPIYSSSIMTISPALPGQSTIASYTWSDGGRNINPAYAYTQAQKDWYSARVAWGNTSAFPNNHAKGWYWSVSQGIASVIWDFQQQAVITEIINKIISNMQTCEDNTLNFKCAGYMLDIADFDGDMHSISGSSQPQVDISYWTGTNSCLLHSGITHEFATYRDGVAAFYKQFRVALLAAFPGAKWIIDPARIWSPPSWGYEEYVYTASNRTDAAQLIPDLLMQEGWDTDFVDQPQTFNALQINANPSLSGLGLTKSMVGCHQRTKGLVSEDNLMAASAGINGAWYNWFILFGYTGSTTSMPGFSSIAAVYPRLKLTRCVPNWDNLTGATGKTWDGSVYSSSRSYLSSDIIWSKHWKTNKIFTVFLTTNGILTIGVDEQVSSIQKTDGLMVEAGNGLSDFTITGNQVRINSGDNLNKCYIVTTQALVSNPPSTTTNSATSISPYMATLNGIVNPNGYTTQAWFEYDITQALMNSTPVIEFYGSSNTATSAYIQALLPNTKYYFRAIARNIYGTAYGSVLSFTTTQEAEIPIGSVLINDGSSYTKTRDVSLYLLATDNIGVTGYFVSSSATTPSLSDTAWVSITPAISYTATVAYTLTTGNGTKTVYVWYRDLAGNISTVSSDTVVLDEQAPSVTIDTPTSSSTYTVVTSTISLAGTASDNYSGILGITWVNNRGGSGTANGTTSWNAYNIGLYTGINVITITATDGAGNIATDIITVTRGIAPTASTFAPTSIATTSATMNGVANAGFISTAVWFKYGTTSGVYTNTTSTQNITGSSNTDISANVSGLTQNTIYYYRIVADNVAGLVSGSELSFRTLDADVPVGSVSINSNATYSISNTVTLNLSASDTTGVTGYYVSENTTTPDIGDGGWVSVTPAVSYSANIQKVLSSGDGTKTIYAWYRDAGENISIVSSDTIIVDTTHPGIAITLPVSTPYTVQTEKIDITGTASDANGISAVTWTNDKGGNGTATGTTSWSISQVTLYEGINIIQFTASDMAGLTTTTSITIIYEKQIESSIISAGSLRRKRVRYMDAIYNNLIIKQGSTFPQTFQLKQSTGTPIDLTGYNIRGQIRKTAHSKIKVFDFAATIDDAVNGIISILLTDAQTTTIPAGLYAYDIEIYVIGGTVERIIEGSVVVTPESTRD